MGFIYTHNTPNRHGSALILQPVDECEPLTKDTVTLPPGIEFFVHIFYCKKKIAKDDDKKNK